MEMRTQLSYSPYLYKVNKNKVQSCMRGLKLNAVWFLFDQLYVNYGSRHHCLLPCYTLLHYGHNTKCLNSRKLYPAPAPIECRSGRR